MTINFEPIEFEPIEGAKPSIDFEPIDFEEDKLKTSLMEDLKIGGSAALNTGDKYWSLLAGGLAGALGYTDEADKIFNEVNARAKARMQGANPENKEQGFSGKLVGALPQVLAFPFSPAETGMTLADAGETPRRAQAGAAIDTAGNVAGIALPGAIGKNLTQKVVTGAAANAAQDIAVRKAIQGVAQTEEGDKAFEVTPESTGIAAVMGGVLGGVVPSARTPEAPAPKSSGIGSIIEAEKAKPEAPVEKPAIHFEEELLPSNAPQYGIDHSDNSGHWSKDENGIPIRTDLSIEAQQLQNPLQRNLWGDELGPAQGFETSLTDSINSENAGAFKGAVEATDEMDAALNRNNPELPQVEADVTKPFVANAGLSRGQGGGVDISLLVPKKLLDFVDNWRRGGGNLSHTGVSRMIDDNPTTLNDMQRALLQNQYPGTVDMYQKRIDAAMDQMDYAKAARYKKRLDDALIADALIDYHKAYGSGFILDGSAYNSKTGPQANRVQAREDAARALNLAKGPGRRQSGGVDFEAVASSIRRAFGGVTDSKATPTTPASIAAKQMDINKLKVLGAKMPEWTDVSTMEEAIALGAEAKDIKSTALGQNATNLNNMTVWHNNPVLRYARKMFLDARFEQNDFSRTYITNKDTGLAKALTDLSSDESVRVNDVLTHLDKNEVEFSSELATKLGLTPNETKAISAARKIATEELAWRNRIRKAQGVEEVPARAGYSPSILRGDYKSVVLDKNGNAVGFIGADTPGEFKRAIEYYKEKHPEATFSQTDWKKARRDYSRQSSKGFVYRDFQDALALLAKHDPNFGKVQAEIEMAITKSAVDLYNFDVHSLEKKGISGARGDKPWKSASENAKERFDAMIKFYEEAAEHHSLQKPIMELNLLQKTDQLKHQENTFAYLDKYIKNATGGYTHSFGNIVNTIFDEAHKIVEHTNVMGPSQTLKASNFVRNKMSQHFMGWFNWMFTVSQIAQPVQTVLPVMQMVNERLGNKGSLTTSAAAGGKAALWGFLRETGAKVSLPEHLQAAYDYGRRAGMFDFSELERAYEGHKSRVGRAYDQIAEVSMQLGEKATRGPAFLSYVDLLHQNGFSGAEAIRVAENLTNMSMFDYHPYERPMMYSGMGVMGQHVGALRTYAHGSTAQLAILTKEGKKNLKPILLSVAGMLAFAGVSGMPFYADIDAMYGEITELLGKRSNISSDFMKNWEQWIKTGLVSDAMGYNMQGKFSAANMVPDSLAEGFVPQLSGAADIVSAAFEQAKYNDAQSQSNLAVAATPQGWKQATRSLVKKDEKGFLLDKNQNRVSKRTPEEWAWSARTGLAPTKEAVARQELYAKSEMMKADDNRRFKIVADFDRALRSGQDLKAELKRYHDAGGNPAVLLRRIKNIKVKQQMTEELRVMGIPTNADAALKRKRFTE